MTWSQSGAGIHRSMSIMWLVRNERVTKQCYRDSDSDSYNSARASGHHEQGQYWKDTNVKLLQWLDVPLEFEELS